ncbi:EPIDERMAL PATTERNING FACTOR-like protein 2 [Glycine soja]|uniref:Epidermal patterning factor-like protein n=1 Tax=Glycine soja TaxID=3848 RepID=A0A0B2PZN5_GLYSO|nr:EPIDERMAL PATTERNING FACTOR-like protein 2 [Glycine soja]KHN13027.1 EPIDERMAL PATTERNING FACTOR-like protein 2 [Glycine soja]RZB78332.1 EPIDERMAL PATTERNING FACTOR-like protein 2 isoform B [Glycine soja]
MSFSGRFPLTSGEIGGFLLFQCSTCLIYHLFVVLTSQVVNSNANASPLHCSNYYIIFGFLFLDRGSSTEGESLILSEMGRDHHHVVCGQRLSFLSISLCFLIISSWTQMGLVTEGRKTPKQNGFYQAVHDDKAMVRAQIGSRPPRCERRCRSCGHCEAIQVPTNPQAQNGKINSSTVSTIAFTMGEGSSNYKPMSWKCKCGNRIFNP